MSLINDALNKAQRERSQPRGSNSYHSPGFRLGYHRPVRVKSLGFIWVTASAVAVLLLIGVVYLRLRSSPGSPQDVPVASVATPNAPIATVAASDSVGPTPGAARAERDDGGSPFVAQPAAAPVAAPSADYDLVGMSAMGSTTLLSVVRRSDQRSFWVPVGKTVGEITVVSYDEASDRAVIRVRGATQTLALRQSGPTPATPTAAVAE